MDEKKDISPAEPAAGNNSASIRRVLLKGIFWRILIIEGILLVWSLFFRVLTDHHAAPIDLFWYAVRLTLLTAVIILFITITFQRFLNRKIIKPLEAIAASNRQLQSSDAASGDLSIPEDTPNEIKEIITTRADLLSTILKVSDDRLRLNNFIREMFGRYLSEKIVDNILESPEGHKIGGHRKTVTILLSDIRGFTGLSETLDPQNMVLVLNRYLEKMTKIIMHYDGVIDEIVGDSIMAVFGVPEGRDTDAERAVACALAMQIALAELNREFSVDGYPPLEMGVGINTGKVIVGNIGSEMRMKYGVVGTAVNIASRIEANTVGGQVIIGESTYNLIKDLVTCETPQSFMVKGIKTPLVIYTVSSIGPPYNLQLGPTSDNRNGIPIKLAFRCWKVEDKNVIGAPLSGETLRLDTNVITADLQETVTPLTDLKISFEFCVEAHCFGDIYAKVISSGDEARNGSHQLQITSINPKDRHILDRWALEAG